MANKEKGGGSGEAAKPTEADISSVLELPLVKQLTGDLKELYKIDVSTVLSAADDEIHERGEKDGKAVGRMVDNNSWVRSWIIRRLSAIAINQLEKYAKTLPSKTAQGLVVKLADYCDSFRVAFFGSKEAADAAEKEFFAKNPEMAKALDTGLAAVAEEGMRLLIAAPAARTGELGNALNARATAAREFADILANGPKPVPEKKARGVPFKTHVATAVKVADAQVVKFNTGLAPVVQRIKNKADAVRLKEAWEATPGRTKKERIGWSWRLLKRFLG